MRTCKTCIYFRDGNCVRYPPQLVAVVDNEYYDATAWSEFPTISENDFCGEYRAGYTEGDELSDPLFQWRGDRHE